ncbi:11380_t:CDS:2 [Racocetra persica]|uniref:11380_t:CDS:1 n=1 Tax=Racocetra persica TaxID=160502 RepID=A0ACA9KN08_9GLOM|nr:11380_t:CDS:2 [Racocetra persica]
MTTQSELKENDYVFQCETATCKFVADSKEFAEQPAVTQTNQDISQALNLLQVHDVDSNKSSLKNIGSSQNSYRYILPCVSFQQLNK